MAAATVTARHAELVAERWNVATTRPILYGDGTVGTGNSKRYERLGDDLAALAAHVAGDTVDGPALEAFRVNADEAIRDLVTSFAAATLQALETRRESAA